LVLLLLLQLQAALVLQAVVVQEVLHAVAALPVLAAGPEPWERPPTDSLKPQQADSR